MRWLIVIALFCAVETGMADQVTYENTLYNVEHMENKYLIFPQFYSVLIDDVSGLSKNDCNRLEEDIAVKEKNYYVCDRNANSSYCRLLKEDILFKSKEENHQSPVILYPINRAWSMSLKIPTVDELSLKNFIADKYHLNIKDLIVVLQPKKRLNGPLNMEMVGSSLLSRVIKLVPLLPGALEPLKIIDGRLETNNRFLACDLENHRVTINGNLTARFNYAESIDDNDLAQIWELYQELQQFILAKDFRQWPILVKAGLLGHFLGTRLKSSNLSKEKFSLEVLINDLFYIEDGELLLKRYSSKSDLKSNLYPDNARLADFELKWGHS